MEELLQQALLLRGQIEEMLSSTGSTISINIGFLISHCNFPLCPKNMVRVLLVRKRNLCLYLPKAMFK